MSFAVCSNCQARVIPHRVCPDCGYYRGRQVITIEDVKERKKEKKPGKEAKKKAPQTSKKGALPAGKTLSVEELSKKDN